MVVVVGGGGAEERVLGPIGMPVTSTAEDTVCISCPTLLGPKASGAPTLLCVAPPGESQHFTFSSVPSMHIAHSSTVLEQANECKGNY